MKIMALTKIAPTFETENETLATESAAPAVATPKPAAALVVPPKTQVSTGFGGMTNPITALKDAVRVSFDSLTSLVASNGAFKERETKRGVGDEITFELLSWQDSYVVQTGDDKSDKSLVKYSDDGIVCSDGTLVKDHLDHLRQLGWEKASVKERAVVVGSVISCPKGLHLVDDLVQFDLSPKSRGKFSRYQLLALNALRLGKATPEQVTKIRAHTEAAVAGANDYTVVVFDIAQ